MKALDNKLEAAYEVTAIFSEEETADMRIYSTSKKEVAKLYLLIIIGGYIRK